MTLETTHFKRIICFFGHHRCGSTWASDLLRVVCRELAWKFTVLRESQAAGDLARFVERDRTDVLVLSNAEPGLLSALPPYRGFHIVRDPRDVVVSSYYSHLYSHSTREWKALETHRRELIRMSPEEGLMHEIVECRKQQFDQMGRWDYDNESVLEARLENLAAEPLQGMREIFRFIGALEPGSGRVTGPMNRVLWKIQTLPRGYLTATVPGRPLGLRGRGVSAERLDGIVRAKGFSRLSGGRKRGEEDLHHHYRKGSKGDWKQLFSPAHRKAFKARYNSLLVKLGYEQGEDW